MMEGSAVLARIGVVMVTAAMRAPAAALTVTVVVGATVVRAVIVVIVVIAVRALPVALRMSRLCRHHSWSG